MKKRLLTLSLASFAFLSSCEKETTQSDVTISTVMDGMVTRMLEQWTIEQLDTLSQKGVLAILTPNEKEALATKYWSFDVDVPVTVSVMRHEQQEEVPFWLETGGFKKTDLQVKNENFTYEVWQKDYPAGRVALGINGFDKHRPVYFVSVGAKDASKEVKISNVYPENQHFETMDVGAFTYHDWDGLKLEEVPEVLKGHTLLTTIRGRAREAHLIKAFRETPFPSSNIPDQLLLTWSDDPKTTMDVQWRTAASVKENEINYWVKGNTDTLKLSATFQLLEDRLIRNDRYVNRYTAQLNSLQAGTTYEYRVGNAITGWSNVASFQTASDVIRPFSFIWFGDTHHSPLYGDMASQTLARHPEISFFQIAGDLVTTGLYRDDWDQLWGYSKGIYAEKPLMAIPGNHDSQDGLGAQLYRDMFSFPTNGPKSLPTELSYSYVYQNALFVMLDVTQSITEQRAWLEQQLKESKEKWKFVMLHFPPYNFDEDYAEIRKEWGTLFDKYHVDMVMSGHMHYYLRTHPMNNEKIVRNPSEGTIYTMSVSIPGKQKEWPDEHYAVKRYKGGPLYQHISITDNRLVYRCLDTNGEEMDRVEIKK